MFKFPDLPHSLVVRHLECISCKHMLEISESEIDRRGRIRNVASRYFQHHKQAVIRESQLEADRRRTIDCPRCGADNRNWLYLSLRPYVERLPYIGRFLVLMFTITLVLAGPLLLIYRRTQNELNTRNVLLVIVAYLALILPILILSPRWRDLRDHKYLQHVTGLSWYRHVSPLWASGLLLVFFLAVILPVGRYLVFPIVQNKLELLVAPKPQLEGSARVTKILNTVNNDIPEEIDVNSLALSINNIQQIVAAQQICQEVEWDIVRTRLEHVKQASTNDYDMAVLTDVIKNLDMAFSTGTCQPKYFFLASGILQEYWGQLATNPAYTQCATITDDTKKSLCLLSDRLSKVSTEYENSIPPVWKWQDLTTKSKEDILAETNRTLVDLRQYLATSATLPVQEQIDTELGNIERLFESRALQSELTQNVDFVVAWMKLVGLAGILSTIIAVHMAKHDEQLYDPNLPRPVFHSVAAMAPTVIWELDHTVGLPVSAHRIQWMNIERNGHGGVTLTGLYRSASKSNDTVSNRVRGQEFVVKTDPWCCIQNTSIRDIMVFPSLNDDKPPMQTEEATALPEFSVTNGRIQSL